MTRHHYAPLADWQAFEDLCHDLFRELWDAPTIVKHGRGGEVQDGVDLYGLLPDGTWFGVQCKAKGAQKQLKRNEMRKELAKVEGFNPRLSRYVFATTAERKVQVQKWARDLTEATSFEVSVFAWDDICEALTGRHDLIRRHLGSSVQAFSEGGTVSDAATALDTFRRQHWSDLLPLPSLAQARGQRHADLLLTDVYTSLDVNASVRVEKAEPEPQGDGGKDASLDRRLTSISLPGERAYLEALIAHELSNLEADDSKYAPKSRQRRCRALEAAAANRRLVLVGAAGSGKSTFGRFLVVCLLGASLGLPEANLATLLGDVEEGFLPWPHGTPLAFFVSLQKLQGSPAFPGVGEPGEARHLVHYLQGFGPEASRSAFSKGLEEALQRRDGVLVVLDGLDETPSGKAGRVQLRQLICGFVRAYPDCRVLVTSRPYAYKAESPWRLDDAGFANIELAPFDASQQETFVEAWYRRLVARQLLNVGAERQHEMCGDLVGQIRGTGYLGELAKSPLMLTMMADVHASNSGRLPSGGRAALYGESVALLLDRWNEARDDGKPSEDLGMTLDQIQEALQKLAFEVHRSRGVGDPEAPPEIQRSELWEALVSLRDAHDVEGTVDDQRIMDYLHQRSGILMGESEKVYRFPHRSYQEYLAAAYLVDSDDFPDLLDDVVTEDPNLWREVVQLAMGQTAKKKSMAWAIVEMLVPEAVPEDVPRLEDPRFLRALLGGLALRESNLWQNVSVANAAKLKRVGAWLRRAVELGALDVRDRAQAGQVLGLLGDDRPGVGLGADGLPSFEWVEISSGSFRMGGELHDDEKPMHDESVDAYRMSRYPVTNVQFEAFVDAEGYSERWRRCWTEAGWAWKVANDLETPKSVSPPFDLPNHPRVAISWYEAVAYCGWLSEVTGDEHRLPSESEWERAARGVDGRAYPWGAEFEATRCNSVETDLGATTAVGLFPGGESPAGILDASGNVLEWCSTRWRETNDEPEKNSLEGDAVRVLRGGSFASLVIDARCAYRGRDVPDGIGWNIGFRLAAPSELLDSDSSDL